MDPFTLLQQYLTHRDVVDRPTAGKLEGPPPDIPRELPPTAPLTEALTPTPAPAPDESPDDGGTQRRIA